MTHRTVSADNPNDSTKSDQDPNYNVSLDRDYQDFTSYIYMGNRVENFTAYFNTFYRSQSDFNDAYDEYRATLISLYNRKLDSLGISPPISSTVKDKLDKAIERSSKIIQYHKNSKYLDDAVLIIGKSYYFEGEYYKAERTFNEFLSKLSSSVLADEAILYLGQTKMRIGKKEEGEKIFSTLVKNSSDNEVRSLAARDLGVIAYNNKRLDDAVNYFKESIDFSKDEERKAEGQFILAKILTEYKPELAASEYKKVLDYTSDFDLQFYARLNYAKGLIVNKEYSKADEELEDIRKKYRDEAGFTQLIDLEIANNYFAENKIPEAMNKYYEVIVKYPNTPSSASAYYFLAKYEEEVNKDYLNAFVNYKKSVDESTGSDYYNESSAKATTYEKYFTLREEVSDSGKVKIPTSNANVENFRQKYNEEKGIENQNQPIENNGTENNDGKNGTNDEGIKTGDGKGKPGGFKNYIYKTPADSLEEENEVKDKTLAPPVDNPKNPPRGNKKNNENPENPEEETKNSPPLSANEDSLKAIQDSLKAAQEIENIKARENKVFNAYFELAELFMYNINQKDSAEYYLKTLLTKFPESDKQAKLLYTLGNFYKNNNRKSDADETFGKIISNYPNTIYASESRKILGLKSDSTEIKQNPIDEIFTKALNFFNDNKFTEAIAELQLVESGYPKDTMVAKSLYSIGWIYENKLVNKDSSLFYYKKLIEKFPESEYSQKVLPMVTYIASLEPKETPDSTKENSVVPDSTGGEVKETPKEENKGEETVTEKKDDGEVKVDPNAVTTEGETKLSQEEINKLLKEGEQENPPK